MSTGSEQDPSMESSELTALMQKLGWESLSAEWFERFPFSSNDPVVFSHYPPFGPQISPDYYHYESDGLNVMVCVSSFLPGLISFSVLSGKNLFYESFIERLLDGTLSVKDTVNVANGKVVLDNYGYSVTSRMNHDLSISFDTQGVPKRVVRDTIATGGGGATANWRYKGVSSPEGNGFVLAGNDGVAIRKDQGFLPVPAFPVGRLDSYREIDDTGALGNLRVTAENLGDIQSLLDGISKGLRQDLSEVIAFTEDHGISSRDI